VHAQVRDDRDSGYFKGDTFAHSITNFTIYALPDPIKSAREIRRTLGDGGMAMVTVWKLTDTTIIHGVPKTIRRDLLVFYAANPDWSHDWNLVNIMEEAGFSKLK